MADKIRLIGYGILSWLAPFLVSFIFYGPGGVLLIDYDLFKTLMVVVGSGTGAILLYMYFRVIRERHVREAWIAGIGWMAINWLLDLVFLLPLSRQAPGDYVVQIGLRYFMILFMSLAVGYSLQYAAERAA